MSCGWRGVEGGEFPLFLVFATRRRALFNTCTMVLSVFLDVLQILRDCRDILYIYAMYIRCVCMVAYYVHDGVIARRGVVQMVFRLENSTGNVSLKNIKWFLPHIYVRGWWRFFFSFFAFYFSRCTPFVLSFCFSFLLAYRWIILRSLWIKCGR